MIGQTIAHYTITEKIGQGGMGEVYRATDTKLKRDVALKVLPDSFTQDPQRMGRFQREAEVLASLNHPNIAAIYGLEEAEGRRFLVLELAEGETLADRIKKGPLPVDDALEISRQIAEGLESAHEKGIIHRDLKPANVNVTPEGKVKILDFGLAKALHEEPDAADFSYSPTLTNQATREGVILGTAAYMAPEQAKGQPVDKRADIWAFGCVLYEMLTGTKTFEGESATDILGAIIHKEPNWESLPPPTPWIIRTLLRQCLSKDRDNRLHDIADARIGIEAVQRHPSEAEESIPVASFAPVPLWRQALPWIITAMVTIAAIFVIWNPGKQSQDQTALDVVKFDIALPETHWLSGVEGLQEQSLSVGFQRPSRRSICFSPDGKQLVYSAITGGKVQLYLRPTDQLQATPIPGTEGGSMPFFSPEGRWIGFWADGKLKKVSLNGGLPVDIADASPWPASWGSNGMIVFNKPGDWGLWQVSDSGGDPQPLTKLEEGETGHTSPEVLPGGKAVLFAVRNLQHKTSHTDIVVQSLETGKRQTLVKVGSHPQYVPTGHLIFARDGDLLAAPFDLDRLTLTGNPIPVMENVMQAWYAITLSTGAAAQVAFSQTGTLAYVPGNVYPEFPKSLVFMDRKGTVEPVVGSPKTSFASPRIAPNDQQIVYSTIYRERSAWIFDTSRGVSTQLTFEGGAAATIWTPDGRRVAFGLRAVEEPGIYWMPADRSASMERLPTGELIPRGPYSWSPDGKLLAFGVQDQDQRDIWILDREEQKVHQFTDTPQNEAHAEFSQDGRYLAYSSDETGRREVYVQPYPGPGERTTISTGGGGSPLWSPDGRQLFYRRGQEMMAVDIKTSPSFSAGKPKFLFEGDSVGNFIHRNYDITPDGEKFLMVQRFDPPRQPARQIIIVQNWFEELKRLVPTDN